MIWAMLLAMGAERVRSSLDPQRSIALRLGLMQTPTPTLSTSSAEDGPALGLLKWAAMWLEEDDPEWVEGGCADMSGLLFDFAVVRGLNGVRVVSGWASRGRSAKMGFPHVWLDVDGTRFDPVAFSRSRPLMTYVEDASAGRLAVSGSYLDPDDDMVREDNAFRLAALLRAAQESFPERKRKFVSADLPKAEALALSRWWQGHTGPSGRRFSSEVVASGRGLWKVRISS